MFSLSSCGKKVVRYKRRLLFCMAVITVLLFFAYKINNEDVASVYISRGDSCYVIGNVELAKEYYIKSNNTNETGRAIAGIIKCEKVLGDTESALRWLDLYENATEKSVFTALERFQLTLNTGDSVAAISLLDDIIDDEPIELESLSFLDAVTDPYEGEHKRYSRYYMAYFGRLNALSCRMGFAKSDAEIFTLGKKLFHIVEDRNNDYMILKDYKNLQKPYRFKGLIPSISRDFFNDYLKVQDNFCYNYNQMNIEDIAVLVSEFKWQLFNDLIVLKHKCDGFGPAIEYANSITRNNTCNTDAFYPYHKFFYRLYWDANKKRGNITASEIDSILHATSYGTDELSYTDLALVKSSFLSRVTQPMIMMWYKSWTCDNDTVTFNKYVDDNHGFLTGFCGYYNNKFEALFTIENIFPVSIHSCSSNEFTIKVLKYEFDKQAQKKLIDLQERIKVGKYSGLNLNDFALLYYKAMCELACGNAINSRSLFNEALSVYQHLEEKDSLNDKRYIRKECIGIYSNLLMLDYQLATTQEQFCVQATADRLMELGSLFVMDEFYGKSTICFKEAFGIYSKLAKKNNSCYGPCAVRAVTSLATSLINLGNYSDGEHYSNEALALCSNLEDAGVGGLKSFVAKANMNLGHIYKNYDELEKSQSYYEMAIVVYASLTEETEGYEIDLAQALNIASKCDLLLGKYEACLQKLNKAKGLFEKSNNKEGLAMTSLLKGVAFLKLGKLDESELAYLESIQMQSDSLKIDMITRELENIKRLKFYNEQIELIKYQIVSFEKPQENNLSNHDLDLVNAYSQLVYLYYNTARYDELLDTGSKMLSIYRALPNSNQFNNQISQLFGYMSQVYILKKDFAKAEDAARNALKVNENALIMGDTDLLYSNLAASLLFQGKYSEAEMVYIHNIKYGQTFINVLNNFMNERVIPSKYKPDVERIMGMLTVGN